MFNKELNAQLDSNGSEAISSSTNPNWWTGSGKESARGLSNVATFFERQAGAIDSTAADALGVNRYVQRNGKVGAIHDITPVDPATLPKYQKADPRNSGAAAVFMGDLFQLAPALAATAVNPLLGGALAGGMAADRYAQEADERGLKGRARYGFIGLHALEEGVGAALPGIGGIGERALVKYGSRFVVGGLINEGISEAGNYSRAEILDRYGYHGQAEQMRQWDLQAAAANFVMGGVFNLVGGHSRKRPEASTSDPVITAAPTEAKTPISPAAEQPTPSLSTSPQAAPSPVPGARLSREGVKQAKSDAANAARHLERISAEELAIKQAAPTGSGGANRRYFDSVRSQLDELQNQRAQTEKLQQSAAERLDAHEQFNRQRIESMHTDASTHTALHDNYVTESAPGLATDAISESAHTRAMDDAMDAFHTGRAVDVSEHYSHESGMLTASDLDSGTHDRLNLIGDSVDKTDAVTRAANEQSVPESKNAEVTPGQLSQNIDQPFTLLRAQGEALRATHPELADAIKSHIDSIETDHQRAHAEAAQYDIAAACAIVHGA